MADSFREWVIFDGDNTLWDVESLYDRARDHLCTLLTQFGVDPHTADKFQRARDAELHGLYGYSSDRFPQSFADTLNHFLGDKAPELEQRVREIAKNVFRARAPLVPNVDQTLQRLRSKYSLALLTAGDAEVQAQRLEAFGRTECFNAVCVVPSKSRQTLQSLLLDYLIDRKEAWVVGDSIRSDIEPAVALGVRAIHLDVANWHPIERGDRELPANVQRASSLLEVCEILGC